MQVVYVNGSRSDLTWHEMRKLFWHRYFVGIVLTASAIVVALRPYDDMVDLNVVRLTIFYANSVACFVTVLVGLVYLTQNLGRTVYASAVIAMAVVIATIYGISSATLLGAHIPPLIDIALVTVFNLVFGLVGELVFASFFVPMILREIGASPLYTSLDKDEASPAALPDMVPEPQPVEPTVRTPVVTILGSDFIVSELVFLSAEAHYVRVFLRSGKQKLLRGRISDAVEAMPKREGQLVHRSHWVANSAVDRMEPEGRNHVLVLVDGRRLPVARSRLQDIRDWVSDIHKRKEAS